MSLCQNVTSEYFVKLIPVSSSGKAQASKDCRNTVVARSRNNFNIAHAIETLGKKSAVIQPPQNVTGIQQLQKEPS